MLCYTYTIQRVKEATVKTRIAIFQRGSFEELQTEINQWLAKFPKIELQEVAQSQGDGLVTISIWYDEPDKGK